MGIIIFISSRRSALEIWYTVFVRWLCKPVSFFQVSVVQGPSKFKGKWPAGRIDICGLSSELLLSARFQEEGWRVDGCVLLITRTCRTTASDGWRRSAAYWHVQQASNQMQSVCTRGSPCTTLILTTLIYIHHILSPVWTNTQSIPMSTFYRLPGTLSWDWRSSHRHLRSWWWRLFSLNAHRKKS